MERKSHQLLLKKASHFQMDEIRIGVSCNRWPFYLIKVWFPNYKRYECECMYVWFWKGEGRFSTRKNLTLTYQEMFLITMQLSKYHLSLLLGSATRPNLKKKIPEQKEKPTPTVTAMKADRLLNQVSASHCCPPWKQSSEGVRTDNISWHSILQNQSLSVTAQKSRGTLLPSAARRKGWADPLGAHKASS